MADPVNPLPESHLLDTEPIWTGMGTSAEMEAIGIQRLLAASGIEAIVNGSSTIPSVEFEVLVTRENAARARQVVSEALAAGPAGAEEAERATELP
jgi:hypothetical protein